MKNYMYIPVLVEIANKIIKQYEKEQKEERKSKKEFNQWTSDFFNTMKNREM